MNVFFLICTYVNVFVEGQKLRFKRESYREVVDIYHLNMVEPCFVYMKEATLRSDFSALLEGKVTKGTPLN